MGESGGSGDERWMSWKTFKTVQGRDIVNHLMVQRLSPPFSFQILPVVAFGREVLFHISPLEALWERKK